MQSCSPCAFLNGMSNVRVDEDGDLDEVGDFKEDMQIVDYIGNY